MLELRGILRRSQRARNRHFSHMLPLSAASAPHVHCRPLRHPFNLRPMLITSRQRSLAFRKVRDAKNAAPPGYHWFRETPRFVSFRASPTHSSGNGVARLYSVSVFLAIHGPARAVSSPARAGCLWVKPAA